MPTLDTGAGLRNLIPAVLVDYQDSGWRYKVIARDDATDYSSPEFDDSAWATGQAAFGAVSSSATAHHTINTTTSLNARTWLRRTIDGPLTNVSVVVAADNTGEVWWNGTFLGSFEYGAGNVSDYENEFYVPPAALDPDVNVLAVRVTDDAETSVNDVHFADAQVVAATRTGVSVDVLGDIDTTTTPPTNGQALVYDADTGVWVPGPAGESVLDWVSVANHGATGDGTTDDTYAIQAALDATPEGGVCYFPVGTYAISSTLVLPHAMRLLGALGWRWVRIVAPSNTTAILATYGYTDDPDGSYWAAENIEIVGGWAGTETSGSGIYSTTSVYLRRVRTVGFYDGFRLASTGATQPIFYSKLDHCAFDAATRDGVRLEGRPNNFTWRDCRANNNGVGVHVVGGGLSVRIEGGGFDNNGLGIDVDGTGGSDQSTAGVLIAGVYMESGDGDTDIRIGNATAVTAVRIESVTFIKPSFTGTGTHVLATNVDGLTITDCELNSSGAAINVSTPATNVTYGRNRNRNGGTITLPAGSIRLDDASIVPEPVGAVAAAGTSHYLARADHVHEGDGGGGGTGRWEVVVSGNPAEAVTTVDGTDWLYAWIED